MMSLRPNKRQRKLHQTPRKKKVRARKTGKIPGMTQPRQPASTILITTWNKENRTNKREIQQAIQQQPLPTQLTIRDRQNSRKRLKGRKRLNSLKRLSRKRFNSRKSHSSQKNHKSRKSRYNRKGRLSILNII